MTTGRFQLSATAAWMKDFLVLWGVGVMIFSTVASVFFYFARNEIAAEAWEFLGLDKLASSQQIEALKADIEALTAKLDEVTGEDGYLVVSMSQSYVLEPVSLRDNVTVRYLMRRTARGADCIFVKSTPLFRDLRDISFPGQALTPPIQVSASWRRVQTTFAPPANLIPGRVEISVSLEYECNGERQFDEIGALAFELLEPTE